MRHFSNYIIIISGSIAGKAVIFPISGASLYVKAFSQNIRYAKITKYNKH
jgi:hypothetical protein